MRHIIISKWYSRDICTYVRREDLDPSRLLALSGVLEGEGGLLKISLVIGHHIPSEHVLLALKHACSVEEGGGNVTV